MKQKLDNNKGINQTIVWFGGTKTKCNVNLSY